MVKRYAGVADLLAELMKRTRKTPQALLRELIAKYLAEGKIKGKTGSVEFARLVGLKERDVLEMLNDEDNRFGLRRQRDMERRCGLPEGYFSDGGEIAEQVKKVKKQLWDEFASTRTYAFLSETPGKLRLLKSMYDNMPMREPPYPTVPMLEGFAAVLLGKLQTTDDFQLSVEATTKASEPSSDGTPKGARRTTKRTSSRTH